MNTNNKNCIKIEGYKLNKINIFIIISHSKLEGVMDDKSIFTLAMKKDKIYRNKYIKKCPKEENFRTLLKNTKTGLNNGQMSL